VRDLVPSLEIERTARPAEFPVTCGGVLVVQADAFGYLPPVYFISWKFGNICHIYFAGVAINQCPSHQPGILTCLKV
jgi:hypothetical protein